MSILSERIKQLRKNNGISQDKLAKVLGYGYTAVVNYESGRNEPSIYTLIKIADYFDVSIDYLLGREFKNKDLNNKFEKLSKEEKNIIINIINLFLKKRRL